MTKHKNPYTFPLKSRKAMAEYIASNGGYYGDRTQYALEFNVGAYPDLDLDSLLKVSTDHETKPGDPVWMDVCREVYKENTEALWNWGAEDARNSISDGDTYWMLWNGASAYAHKFVFAGRGGKHLCIEGFNGRNLCMAPEELAEEMMDKEAWSYADVRLLYKMVRQWEQDFTSEKATKEVQYQAAWQFFSLVDDAYARRLEDYKMDSNNPAWVLKMHAIVATLKEMFDEAPEDSRQEYLERLEEAVREM